MGINETSWAKKYSDTKFSNTNAKLKNYKIITSGSSITSDGQSLMYVSLQGVPAKVALVDLTTMTAKKEFELPTSKYNWTIEFDSNSVAYFGGAPDGHLYSYDYKTDTYKDFGSILIGNDTTIYDLKLVGTELFIVTANGGSLYSYNLMTRAVTYYGTISQGRTIAKALDYDPINNRLLIGVGTKAELVAFDINTRQFTPVTPYGYNNNSLFYNIKYIDGYFFVRTYPNKDILVLNAYTLQVVNAFQGDSIGVSDKLPNEDAIIFSNNKYLYKFYYKTNHIENMNIRIGSNSVLSFNHVKQNGTDSLLMILNSNGEYINLDLSTNQHSFGRLDVAPQSIDFHELTSINGNKTILGAGFLTGGIITYDSTTRKYKQLNGIGQVESFFEKDNRLYIGVYPSGKVLEYDLTKPWVGGDTQNPIELFRMSQTGQTRPSSIAGASNLDNLYFGFYPEDGIGGGSLVAYNTTTKNKVVYEDYVKNHGISSLKYIDGYIYGGTTIFANGQRATDGAKFFRFKPEDPANKEFIEVPFMQRAMVTGLIEGYFNDVWGTADGYLFNYNPQTGESKVVKILPATSGRFRNGSLVKADNGYIYGTVEGRFFRVNPVTYKVEILKSSNAYNIAKDNKGNIYFYDKADLWTYQPSKAEYKALLKRLDSNLAQMKKLHKDLDFNYRTKYTNPTLIKTNSNNLKAVMINTEKLIYTLQNNDKEIYLRKFKNNYAPVINRADSFTNVVDQINSKTYLYKTSITNQLELGLINENVIDSYNKIFDDIKAIEELIPAVSRQQNRDFLNNTKLEIMRRIQRNGRSAINSELYLDKFTEHYNFGDIETAKSFIPKAEEEISKIKYPSFKVVQEYYLNEAKLKVSYQNE
jgi:hypothetical protein